MNTFMVAQKTPNEINTLIAERIRDLRKRMVDRLLLKNKMNPLQINNMSRLAIVGSLGMTDILEVAKNIGMKERKARTIADEIKVIVSEFGLV